MTNVEKIADEIRNATPVYSRIIDFYEKIFLLQENAKKEVKIDPIVIPDDLLKTKLEENMPLIDRTQFVIDRNITKDLFKKICKLDGNEIVEQAFSKIADAVENETLSLETLYDALLGANDEPFEKAGETLHVEPFILRFVTYSAMKPSIRTQADALGAYFEKNEISGKGYCPVCGELPVLSVLRKEGARSLVCGFCDYEWPVNRIYCPFCENTNQKELGYIFTEEEKKYRVNFCRVCKKYIKTVDTREMNYEFSVGLEQAATIHLDVIASEENWIPGTRSMIL